MNSAIKHWKMKVYNALIVIPFMHEIAPFMQGGFFVLIIMLEYKRPVKYKNKFKWR